MTEDDPQDETNRRIDRLRDVMSDRLANLEDRHIETNQRLGRIESQLGSVDNKLGKLDSLDAKLGKLDSLDAKLGKLDSLDAKLGSVVGRLDRLVEATLRGATAQADRFFDHEQRLSELERRVDELQDRPEP